jgi:hypothetical protein
MNEFFEQYRVLNGNFDIQEISLYSFYADMVFTGLDTLRKIIFSANTKMAV